MEHLSLDRFAPRRGVPQRSYAIEARPLARPLRHAAPLPEALRQLRQAEVRLDERTATLWTFMRPQGRPCFNPQLLGDLHAVQDGMVAMFLAEERKLRYLVLASR